MANKKKRQPRARSKRRLAEATCDVCGTAAECVQFKPKKLIKRLFCPSLSICQRCLSNAFKMLKKGA